MPARQERHFLTSRPAIRQRTLQALAALHLDPAVAGSKPTFPLSMGKLARMLEQEDEPGVLRVVLRVIRSTIEVSCAGFTRRSKGQGLMGRAARMRC
jgi:hypothetical protein